MTYSPEFRESGTRVAIVSLGGVVGKKGRITQAWTGALAWTAPATFVVFPDNAKRIACFIFNESGGDLVVSIGTSSSYTDVCILPPHSSFQVDKDFPWTGALCFRASGGADATAYITELSVEE